MSCYDISKEKVDEIRGYLIEHVFRSPSIMFDDNIRGYDVDDIDLIAIICDLYEYLHVLVYGEKYDYMFHWANKCGSWIETGEFDAVIEEIMKEKEIKSNEENRDNRLL